MLSIPNSGNETRVNHILKYFVRKSRVVLPCDVVKLVKNFVLSKFPIFDIYCAFKKRLLFSDCQILWS